MNDKSVIKRLTELRKEISTSTFLEKFEINSDPKEIVIDLITESGNKLNSLWYIPPTSTDWNWLKIKKLKHI